MKHLILMRHAKSDWSMLLDDHARPLNARGKRAGKALGDWLRQKNILPDEVLSSDSTRTRETFDLLALPVVPQYDQALYLAESAVMLDRLREATGERVLLIGHNPGIAALAASLVAQPPDHVRFSDYPTGATLVAGFDIDSWSKIEPGSGRVVDFVVPRALG